MTKHFAGYVVLGLCIVSLLFLVIMKEREITHQRAWLEVSKQLALGIAYLDMTEIEEEQALHNLMCSIAVNGPGIRHYQERLKEIPWHHQSKEELNKMIETNFGFIKTLKGLENFEEPDFYEKNCSPKCAAGCECNNEHVTNQSTRTQQSCAGV